MSRGRERGGGRSGRGGSQGGGIEGGMGGGQQAKRLFGSKSSPRSSSTYNNCSRRKGTRSLVCGARRRTRRDGEEEEEEEESDEEYGHNSEIAALESYTESARERALLVRATVDGHEAQVLVFKGFSSSLSGRTSYDPSRSVLPGRAIIKSIDVIRGPFDPSNIEYLEKDLTWEAFQSRLQPPFDNV
ncbi:hypothetical protein QJS10_CPB19g01492 [Acorus calamus]|uniref:DUF7734 domain-containing protein n=1 Tax=Acorus calamus TaxID=4465 RepID=A0AAV9CH95_ACOCL|nr:hypothetical protein QJS10_CPB19g01492 [Acorus calamus]